MRTLTGRLPSVVALGAATVLLALAAPGPASAAETEDPCTTVPKSVVAGVLGAPVLRTRPRPSPFGKSCTFYAGRIFPYALITAMRFDSEGEAKTQFSSMIAANAGGSKPPHIGGIGDDAQDLEGMLYTRKGSAIYVFSITNGKPAEGTIAKSEQLAKLVLPQVKS